MKQFLLLLTAATAITFAQDNTVRVLELDAKNHVTTRVDPDYPPIARQMRLSGRVQVDAWIDPTGNVEKVQVVNGNPILSSAASSALKKWKFSPFQAGGKVTRAVANFSFDFKM